MERIQLITFIASSISEKETGIGVQIPEEWITEAQTRAKAMEKGEQGLTWNEVLTRVNERSAQ